MNQGPLGAVGREQLPGEQLRLLKKVFRVGQLLEHRLHHLGLQGVGEGVHIGVVVVKGGFVNLRPLAQLLYGDFLQGLFLPQL